MEIKVVVTFYEMITVTPELEGGFLRKWYLWNNTPKAAWKTLIHEFKGLKLKKQVFFALARKTLKIRFLKVYIQDNYFVCKYLIFFFGSNLEQVIKGIKDGKWLNYSISYIMINLLILINKYGAHFT